MNNINIFISFTAGLISFVAPCVLPLIPGFLSYLAGTSLSESGNNKREIFINSLFFVLGFSIVFSVLGILLNTVLSNVAYGAQIWLSRIGGALIIFFGIYLSGLIKIPFLEGEHKLQIKTNFKSKYLTSLIFGFAFAAGWTPCVGAVLGSILGLAATNPGSAFFLLLSYSLGLGLPFLVVGLFAVQASKLINRYSGIIKYINIVFGMILIILGILVFTKNLSLIANFDLLNKFLLK